MDQHPGTEGEARPLRRADAPTLPAQDETLLAASTAAGVIARLYAGILAGQVQDADLDEGTRTLRTETRDLGHLEVPGGVVVAGDPYLIGEENRPFTRRLPSERPRAVAAACCISGDHWRNLALLLVAGEGPVVRWVGGSCAGDSAEDEDRADWYPVDTGVGCFASPSVLAELDRVMREDDGMLEDPVSRALEESGARYPTQAAIAAPSPGSLSVAACHAGWGDGAYGTWFGLDRQGRAVVVLTDFEVVVDPADQTSGQHAVVAREVVQRAMEGQGGASAGVSTPEAAPRPTRPARSTRGMLVLGIIVIVLMMPLVLMHLRSGGMDVRDVLILLVGLVMVLVGLLGSRRRPPV